MELFLELTRRCNMKCSHCLRGEAQGKDMPELTLWWALRKLGHYGSLGVGGGEPLMSDKHMAKLKHALLQNTEVLHNLDSLYLVTNGKVAYKSDKVLTSLKYMSEWGITIDIQVSTDQFHDDDAMRNKNNLAYIFDGWDNINVHSHGEIEYYRLIDMGRSTGGRPTEIGTDFSMMYVDVDGYVWAACDYSYTFMKKYRDRAVCFGNVITDSTEELEQNMEDLKSYITEKGTIETKENIGGPTRDEVRKVAEIYKLAV